MRQVLTLYLLQTLQIPEVFLQRSNYGETSPQHKPGGTSQVRGTKFSVAETWKPVRS